MLRPGDSSSDIHHDCLQPLGTDQFVVPRRSCPLLGQRVIPDCRSPVDTIHRRYGPQILHTFKKGTSSAGNDQVRRVTTDTIRSLRGSFGIAAHKADRPPHPDCYNGYMARSSLKLTAERETCCRRFSPLLTSLPRSPVL